MSSVRIEEAQRVVPEVIAGMGISPAAAPAAHSLELAGRAFFPGQLFPVPQAVEQLRVVPELV